MCAVFFIYKCRRSIATFCQLIVKSFFWGRNHSSMVKNTLCMWKVTYSIHGLSNRSIWWKRPLPSLAWIKALPWLEWMNGLTQCKAMSSVLFNRNTCCCRKVYFVINAYEPCRTYNWINYFCIHFGYIHFYITPFCCWTYRSVTVHIAWYVHK